ncbi:MAG: ATP-binding cassette domain-containing protein [Verrucomicrobiae bacterium]|nr:ATP-binding cassette domain-containing protein [Verrucomicrobiae bacterium]
MLDIKNISVTFSPGLPNELKALRCVTLQIPEGSFAIVIGTNGSGKSTLLNAIAGVFPVDEGCIRLGGTDLTRRPEHWRALRIGRVFQNPFSGTAPNMTVAENLALAAQRGRARGLGLALNRQTRNLIRNRLENLKMGLENRLDTPIGSLSGGQRQAITLLMATWNKPSLLLLDEHTAALDPQSAAQIVQLTNEIVQHNQITTLMVSHSMAQVAAFGSRVVMMHQGEIIHDVSGPSKQRLRAEDLLAIFEEVRRGDQLDPSAAELLRQRYV